MLIRCINRPFQDLAEGVWREVGDEWEGTPERVAEINRAGYGVMAEAVPEVQEEDVQHEDAPEPAEDVERPAGVASAPQAGGLADMTVRQLTELCEERGIPVPSKPRKADLLAALEGAK